jgi:hypothetical protein
LVLLSASSAFLRLACALYTEACAEAMLAGDGVVVVVVAVPATVPPDRAAAPVAAPTPALLALRLLAPVLAREGVLVVLGGLFDGEEGFDLCFFFGCSLAGCVDGEGV